MLTLLTCGCNQPRLCFALRCCRGSPRHHQSFGPLRRNSWFKTRPPWIPTNQRVTRKKQTAFGLSPYFSVGEYFSFVVFILVEIYPYVPISHRASTRIPFIRRRKETNQCHGSLCPDVALSLNGCSDGVISLKELLNYLHSLDKRLQLHYTILVESFMLVFDDELERNTILISEYKPGEYRLVTPVVRDYCCSKVFTDICHETHKEGGSQ